jgi:hypothetical protein
MRQQTESVKEVKGFQFNRKNMQKWWKEALIKCAAQEGGAAGRAGAAGGAGFPQHLGSLGDLLQGLPGRCELVPGGFKASGQLIHPHLDRIHSSYVRCHIAECGGVHAPREQSDPRGYCRTIYDCLSIQNPIPSSRTWLRSVDHSTRLTSVPNQLVISWTAVSKRLRVSSCL